MRAKTLLILCFLELIALPARGNSSFFDQRYRGWLWFEEKEPEENIKEDKNRPFTRAEMEMIRSENENFKEELELLRHVMIRYPDNIEHIRRYKEKEQEMLETAIKLSYNSAMTNFLYPDIIDELENPQNLYGRKARKELTEKEGEIKLKEVANKVELFLFFQGDCNYCEILERHLARFADKYGFRVEAVSEDGAKSRFFRTHTSKELITQLQLVQMPTVIAVTNDSRIRFELARGAVSVADLEEKALLLADYLRQIEGAKSIKAKWTGQVKNEVTKDGR